MTLHIPIGANHVNAHDRFLQVFRANLRQASPRRSSSLRGEPRDPASSQSNVTRSASEKREAAPRIVTPENLSRTGGGSAFSKFSRGMSGPASKSSLASGVQRPGAEPERLDAEDLATPCMQGVAVAAQLGRISLQAMRASADSQVTSSRGPRQPQLPRECNTCMP
jgi:hypothetical protein